MFQNNKTTRRGFTALEVLLSVAILALLLGVGAPVYYGFEVRNELDIAATEVVQSARRAQVLARASDGDSTWGIYVATSSITVFQGESYALRDTGYDEVFVFHNSITSSSTDEYVFSILTGFPESMGTTTLVSSSGETRTIHINEKGTVLY